MSDDSNLVSRRTALKGIAGVAGTGVVGAGAFVTAAQPAAAVEHELAVENGLIETHDGAVAEIGIGQLWFEVSWENIPDTLLCDFRFSISGVGLTTLDSGDLGVSGEGSETFGYGQSPEYRNEYNEHLGSLGLEVPLSTDSEMLLEEIGLADGEDEKTTTVEFEIRVYRNPGGPIDVLATSTGEFDFVVERLEPDGEVEEGEASPFGSE